MPRMPDRDPGRTPDSGSGRATAGVAPGTSPHTMLVYSSTRRDDVAVTTWIGAALERGEKVFLRHAPAEDRRVMRLLDDSGLAVREPGPVELMDAAAVGRRCRGRRVPLRELHVELADQAVRDGYTGMAMVSNAAANAVLTADRQELVGHEQDLDRLAAEGRLRALCRYHPRTEEALLPGMLALHHRDVDDDIWAASVDGGQLRLRGEIDASNADRVAHVLDAGLAEGVRVVSLAELQFCAVAGVRVFLAAADRLASRDGELVLVDVDPLVARNFAITAGDGRRGLRLVPRGPAQ